jgi:predicted oxidoreductase
MKGMAIGASKIKASQIAYGCMKIGGSWDNNPISEQTRKAAITAVETALEAGINFFDHADIYCRGKSEQVFSEIWARQPGLRQKIYLQSKCGIRFGGDPNVGDPGRYDFSYEHIVHSVEGILDRLKTDYLDILLLHRPDPLVEPEEVARAFDELKRGGKVRHFGVSNHNAAQISLLQKHLDQPLVANQMEVSLLHARLIEEGIITNQDEPGKPVRGDGTLEYCREHGITIQAWGPLAYGYLSGRKPADPSESQVKAAAVVSELAKTHGVGAEAILIAWLLRHPARIQPVIGTTDPRRIETSCQAVELELSRVEWYRLFIAARGAPLP